MNRNLAREVIGCLRLSGSPEASVKELGRFRPSAWKHTLQWLDHSGLALLFWHRLKELEQEGVVPRPLGAQLEQNLRDHRIRVSKMAEEFDSINRCLADAGIRYAALKGFALIPEYCPDAGLRTTYDHDYLVPPASLKHAERALRAAGYARKPEQVEHPLVYFHKTRPPWSPVRRDDLYSARFPTTVELHDRFWDDAAVRIPLRFSQDFFAHIRPRYLDGSHLNASTDSRLERGLWFCALEEDDELIFQVLHAFRHILQNWCRLCSLLDIAWFIEHRSQDTAFWARFRERIQGSEPLNEIVAVVFSLAAAIFGTSIPAAITAETTARLRGPVALWLRLYGQDLALSNFSGNKFSLFLHREFVPNEAIWREVKQGRLFPLHRPNQAAETTNPKVVPRLAAAWKQAGYVAGRLNHHLLGTVRYGLESRRWERTRAVGHRQLNSTSRMQA